MSITDRDSHLAGPSTISLERCRSTFAEPTDPCSCRQKPRISLLQIIDRTAIDDLKERNAWFSTAGAGVGWFRKRRAATFERDCTRPGEVRVAVDDTHGNAFPGLRLRIHKARELSAIGSHNSQDYVDSAVD